MSLLDELIAARSRGDAGGALTYALSEWHRTKHPRVADVIDLLGAEALITFSPPKTRTKETFHQAWLEVAREHDEAATGWLAQTLTQRLPIEEDHRGILRDDYTQTKYAALFERLNALGRRVPDPRIASVLCAMLETPTFAVWDLERTRPIYSPIAELISGQGDVRSIERLQALQRAPRAAKGILREVVAELIDPLITALRRVDVVKLDEPEGWQQLLPVHPVGVADERPLLEAVYAQPSNERLRAVYADALLERGDPRGEFISLQLLREPSSKQIKRMNSLLKSHRAQWLGTLSNVLTRPVFARGFLQSAELAQSSVATEEAWQAAARAEGLATIESLFQGRGTANHYTEFLTSGALRSLKRLDLPSYKLLWLLEKQPLSQGLEHLVLPERGSVKHLVKIGALPLPSLRTLTTPIEAGETAEWVDSLIKGGLIGRITRYEVTAQWGTALPLIREVFSRWPVLEASALSLQDVIEVQRREKGLALTFSNAVFDEAMAVWSSLPQPVTEVRVRTLRHWPVKDVGALRAMVEGRSATLQIDDS